MPNGLVACWFTNMEARDWFLYQNEHRVIFDICLLSVKIQKTAVSKEYIDVPGEIPAFFLSKGLISFSFSVKVLK